MKVLFLDIDGVLNNERTKEKFPEGLFKGCHALDGRLTRLYLNWLKDKDISVVLSSTWRLHDYLMEVLSAGGIHWLDVTPNMGHRGMEVATWLAYSDATEYAILDDTQDFHSFQHAHFVQTSFIHGLRLKNLKRVEKILGL